MFLHRRQDAEISLHAPRVVIADVPLNHLNQVFLAGKALAIVALSFQNAPEALNRAVIDAVRCTGHALRHLCFYELVMKGSIRVLKSSVAVEQRMGVRIGLHRLVKGLKHQRIVVPVTDDVGNDASVTEIKNGTEINLVYFYAFIPLEFCHISKPLLIGPGSVELTVKLVLSDVLRVLCLPRAAVTAVLDGGFNPLGTADTQDTLVVDVNAVVMPQLVVDAPVSLVRAIHVDLLYLLGKLCVFNDPGAQLARCPLVVCRARNMQQAAGLFDGVAVFNMVFLYRSVDVTLP